MEQVADYMHHTLYNRNTRTKVKLCGNYMEHGLKSDFYTLFSLLHTPVDWRKLKKKKKKWTNIYKQDYAEGKKNVCRNHFLEQKSLF